MKNKMITGAIIAIVLLSVATLYWYFTPSNISIVSLDTFPKEIVTGQVGELGINLQNNASEDVNVTINVKNAFVDEKGESLKGFTILAYGNLSNMSDYISPNAVDQSRQEVLLKPGINSIIVSIGYQVPGAQNVVVEIYYQGKLAASSTIEINVPKPKIDLFLSPYESANGTNEIHAVYGYLQLSGKGYALDVMVNVSVIDELTNTTVKTVTRMYGLDNNLHQSEPLVTWEHRDSTYDSLTGARTTTQTETYSPIVVIELAKVESSTEKYVRAPVVVKGKIGDKYKVVVTATWLDQVVSSEMIIPPTPFREKTVEEAITDAQANVSFRILQPAYIPEGYRMNTAQTSGTKFRGVSSELEQASIFYIKGNESLNLQELLVIKDDTDVSASISYKFVDINGSQGRFLEDDRGRKSLNWKVGSLSLTISGYAYNGNDFIRTSLGMDEMIKMARSVK
ncbi:MAG: DUF4367 domain-containing protein [Candidatus Methanoperedens sp.]|nr:DUF4367 domain-containing protein [Candidatus Methanoperedens sp.]